MSRSCGMIARSIEAFVGQAFATCVDWKILIFRSTVASTGRRCLTWPAVTSFAVPKTCSCAAHRGRANPNPHNTPLVTEVCAGEITVTDPTHPLFGKAFKLSGLATLPGHVRHCHVEIRSGCYGYVPVASTNLSDVPVFRSPKSILTKEAIADLLTLFQSASTPGRSKREPHSKSKPVAKPAGRRAKRRRK